MAAVKSTSKTSSQMTSTPRTSVPAQHLAELSEADRELTAKLREYIQSSLANTGILAAFMTGLASVIYTDYPEEPRCFGGRGIQAQLTMIWLSMGCFFLSTLMCVVLSADIDGVPDAVLMLHLHRVSWAHVVPTASVYVGLNSMALGYGIDIGERLGCEWSWFGLICAPLFPLACVLMLLYTRRARAKLNSHLAHRGCASRLGQALFATWFDRIPQRIGVMAAAADALERQERLGHGPQSGESEAAAV